MHNERDAGVIRREIERQCSIGAGTCSYDGQGLEATGLLTVHADLDIAAIERLATRPPAPEDAGTVERVAELVDVMEGMWSLMRHEIGCGPGCTCNYEPLAQRARALRGFRLDAKDAALSRLDGEGA